MKKRFLSLLTAICLTLTLTPVAFAEEAQPDTITLPNGEVREIPTLEDAVSYTAVETQSTQQTIYIDNETDFEAVTSAQWQGNNRFVVRENLNLSRCTRIPSEWGGFIQYFRGELVGQKMADGTYPTISGIPNNCSLIYGIIGGKIENLTFNHGANAAFITFMPVNSSSTPNALEMTNITVEGNITLTGSDQSNYAPFVYCAPKGGITMTNCVNNADISGNIYGGVFYGYYPIYIGETCPYKFTNCTNNGDITMQYAGMFFGNSSSLEGKVGDDSLYLTISGCKNNGKIRGTTNAKYFAAPVAEFDGNMQKIEDLLIPAEGANAEGTRSNTNINVDRITGSGSLCIKQPLTDFSAVLNDDCSITVNRATDESEVSYYVVSVSSYVNLWYAEAHTFYGTDRYTVRESFAKGDLTGDSFTPTIMAYGVADSNFGEEDDQINGYATRYGDDGKLYYTVNNAVPTGAGFYRYVSNQLLNGQTVGNGCKQAEIITVSAYNSEGALLDIRVL